MIDIHCHIVPDVDDGARSLEEAIAMCRRAAEDGCRAMVATPHVRHERWWNADHAELERRLNLVRQHLGPTPALFLGGEIACHSTSYDEILEGPRSGRVPNLAGSTYGLLELDWQGFGSPSPEELMHEASIAGWRPVLAHPERVPWLMRDQGLLEALIDLGTLFQITAGSLTGELGRESRQSAHQLLDAGWAHFVASDAHDLDRRPPVLSEAYQLVENQWGADVARVLFVDNPRAVIENRPLGSSAKTEATHQSLGPRPTAFPGTVVGS